MSAHPSRHRGVGRADHAGPTWLEPMPVRKWMTQSPSVIDADAEVGVAAELMRTRKIRHLPVVDHGGCLIGIVTDRDLRQIIFDPVIEERLGEGSRSLERLPVREVMTWGVITVRPDTDLREAARLMHDHKIGALPVVEHARLLGILSEGDVLAALNEVLRHRVIGIRPLSGQPGTHQPYDYGFRLGGLDDEPWNNGVVD
jgi:acetoin utilization protein AcuB